ncbi:hypothetical protein KAK06_14090 [Ideonella sp. 4Y11]|uniref:Uncharacterized protein n=1 Tax=Ideonella aquatica TaxID=2824119 RepID=A0A940YH94_9BURK|nr:hypothetical protein [Ideonella aquatica]MBQ0960080.1 hypothetical protein [Ideonella aquatica]
MSVRPLRHRHGLRALVCGAAAWLASACWAYPLNLDNTVMRSVVQEQVRGVRHVLVHLAKGATLDERHLVKNDTGKVDARVHATLSQVGDDSYVLQLQSQDLGSADHYRFHVRLDLPKEISCRFGYWTVVDTNLLADDLTSGAKPVYWYTLDDELHVSFHRAQRTPMQFTAGQLQLYFRVVEACV